MAKLATLAKTIRSKNAGVDLLTFDIIFNDRDNYVRVKNSGAITPKSFAKLYRIDESTVTDFILFDPAYAIKITVRRGTPSGSPGDADIFGCQQYAPLLDIEIP